MYAEVFFMSVCDGKGHEFSSKGREGISVSGVSEVISFDDGGVALETVCGSLAIEGEGLRVTTLNISEGIVVVDGKINGLYYYEKNNTRKRSLFGKKE
jgi:sporulation protein YabP